jgi:hypothetical protein
VLSRLVSSTDLADALAQLRDTHRYNQTRLAELTGKPESEISRLLSLLKFEPNVQRQTRGDLRGEITRRHLVAVATLNPAAQQRVFQVIRDKGLTALDAEKLVQDTKAKSVSLDGRGGHQAVRLRYKTTKAAVIIQFRRGERVEARRLRRAYGSAGAGGEGKPLKSRQVVATASHSCPFLLRATTMGLKTRNHGPENNKTMGFKTKFHGLENTKPCASNQETMGLKTSTLRASWQTQARIQAERLRTCFCMVERITPLPASL